MNQAAQPVSLHELCNACKNTPSVRCTAMEIALLKHTSLFNLDSAIALVLEHVIICMNHHNWGACGSCDSKFAQNTCSVSHCCRICCLTRAPVHNRSPSASSTELGTGQPGDLQSMLTNIVSMQSTQAVRFGPTRNHASRRVSSMSAGARLAATGLLTDGDLGDQAPATAGGRVSMIMQHLAARRPSNTSEQSLNAAAGSSSAAGAAAMLQQLTGGRQRGSGCNSSASSEVTGSCSSDDGDEEDSSVFGLTATATESTCGSAVLYNGNGNAAGEGSSTASGLYYSAPRSGPALAKPQPPLVMEALECALSSAHEWQFDAFALADASQGHPLSTLGYYLFHKSGLIEHFGLKAGALARFLRRVEEGYRQNPYHNATHAADVLQTYNAIIHRCVVWSGFMYCVAVQCNGAEEPCRSCGCHGKPLHGCST
jgi:hypothetical protein